MHRLLCHSLVLLICERRALSFFFARGSQLIAHSYSSVQECDATMLNACTNVGIIKELLNYSYQFFFNTAFGCFLSATGFVVFLGAVTGFLFVVVFLPSSFLSVVVITESFATKGLGIAAA
ncbi:hypothetical protein BH10BAC2_BH10BAC2_45110 [soil metagenome]